MKGRLEGVRVLCTRPRERSEELCFLLEDEGAEVLALPLLELLPPEDERPLRSAAEMLTRYAWVCFASPSAVQAFHEAAREAGTLDAFSKVRIGVVGPSTARAVGELGLKAEVEPMTSTGEGLARALDGKIVAGDEVLLPMAQDGRTELGDGLEALGARVTRVVAYRSEPASYGQEVWDEVKKSPPDIVLFGSPRTAEAFLQGAGDEGPALLGKMKRVAIGPSTASALEALGYAADAVASAPTSTGFVDATVQALRPVLLN